MYINHLTLTTGHNARTSRADVDDTTLALLAPWLLDAVSHSQRTPLPVPDLSHYSAKALTQDGGLVVTIYGPQGPHERGKPALGGDGIPLVTIGVAQRSRQSAELWPMMVAQFGAKPGLQAPSTPWCAVTLHPGLAVNLSALEWIGDIERCIAWAWITRKPGLEPVA